MKILISLDKIQKLMENAYCSGNIELYVVDTIYNLKLKELRRLKRLKGK